MKRKRETYYASWDGVRRSGGLDVPVRAFSFEHAASIIRRKYPRDFDDTSVIHVRCEKVVQLKLL